MELNKDKDYYVHSEFENVHVALVHWPVLDKAGTTVCTNITNFDIHDIARAARTYGVKNYHIVNKIPEQLMFVERILDHWRTGYGAKYNPMRKTALHHVKTAPDIESVVRSIGDDVLVVATAARQLEHMEGRSFRQMREHLKTDPKRPVLIIFGTGYGLEDSALKQCHLLLEPILGGSRDEYRHLSVRSAVSICLDRLLSSW